MDAEGEVAARLLAENRPVCANGVARDFRAFYRVAFFFYMHGDRIDYPPLITHFPAFDMKRLLVQTLGLLVVLVTVPCAGQTFVAKYGRPKSPDLYTFAVELRKIRVMENMAEVLSSAFSLPEQVALVMMECGQANAFYNRQQRAIILCYEMVKHIALGIQKDFARVASPDESNSATGGAIGFILMHEVGHALIHLLDLPVLGREEDAADQISAFFMLNSDKGLAHSVAGVLWSMRQNVLVYTRKHFSDDHSLGPQRQSNIACWAFGKDPQKYQYLIQGGFLTVARARRCGAEFRQLDSSVRRLLGSNLTVSP